jgi:hypothetical protein
VNKQRREEGRTPNKRTQGTATRTWAWNRAHDELYNRALQLSIQGRSATSKSELVEAIRSRS